MSVCLCVCPSAPLQGAKERPIIQFKTIIVSLHLSLLSNCTSATLSTTLSPLPPHMSGKVCLLLSLWRLISGPMSTPSSALPTWTSPQGPLSWRSGSLPWPGQRPCSGTGDADQAPGPPGRQLGAGPSPSAGRGQCVAKMIFFVLTNEYTMQCVASKSNEYKQNEYICPYIFEYLNIFKYLT